MAESGDRAAVSRLTAQLLSAFVQGMTARHTRFPPVDDGDIDKAIDIAKRLYERFDVTYPGAGTPGYARTEGERQAMMYRAEHPANGQEEPPLPPLTEDAAVRSEARRLAQMEGRDPDEVPSAGSGVGVPAPVGPAPGVPVGVYAEQMRQVQARSAETGRYESGTEDSPTQTEDPAARAEARRQAQAEGRDPDEVPSPGSGEGVIVPHPLPPGTRQSEERGQASDESERPASPKRTPRG